MPEPAHREGDTSPPQGRHPTGTPLSRWYHLVNEGQVPLDGGLVVLPLLPQLPAQFLLRLLDPPDGEVPLLCLRGCGDGETEAEACSGSGAGRPHSSGTWDRGGDGQ